MVASKVLIAIAIGLALPVQAAPAPIVFDFEDGLQGWELHGSAQRVQTQVLGGEWAIFGDGLVPPAGKVELKNGVAAPHLSELVFLGTSISTSIDLTGIASVSVDQFFVDGSEDGLLLIFIRVNRSSGVFAGRLETLEVVEAGNPSRRAVDISADDFRFTGVRDVAFFWSFASFSHLPPPVVAFIDNITFHPVPEPGTLGLLAGSLAALVIARRRIV